MVVVILLATIDAVWLFVDRLMSPPVHILEVSDFLDVFGAILIVPIAIEIYTSVVLSLTADVIHVKPVVATALMAVARQGITPDDKTPDPAYVRAYAVLGLAFGVTDWLITRARCAKGSEGERACPRAGAAARGHPAGDGSERWTGATRAS